MRDELDPVDIRLPRLRHADREDDRAAAILAVGGGQHEVVGGARGRLPPAAVSRDDLRALREGDQALLHLRPGWEVGRAVHELDHRAAESGVLGEKAVPVVPLVSALALIDRRVRLGPRHQPLEEGEPLEHAGGLLVCGDQRVLHAELCQVIRRLQTAGSRADDDDRVLPGRERPLVQFRHVFWVRIRRASAFSIRRATVG